MDNRAPKLNEKRQNLRNSQHPARLSGLSRLPSKISNLSMEAVKLKAVDVWESLKIDENSEAEVQFMANLPIKCGLLVLNGYILGILVAVIILI